MDPRTGAPARYHTSRVPLQRSFSEGPSSKERLFMGCHPHLWSRDHVRDWLMWCVMEYELDGVKVDKFAMNGKALCMLNKVDFNDRATNVGDVLYNTLQTFIANGASPGVCCHGSSMLALHPRCPCRATVHHDTHSTPPSPSHDTHRLTNRFTAPYQAACGRSADMWNSREDTNTRSPTSNAPLNLSRPSNVHLVVPCTTSGRTTPSPPQLSPGSGRPIDIIHCSPAHMDHQFRSPELSPKQEHVIIQNQLSPNLLYVMTSPQLSPQSVCSSGSPEMSPRPQAASRSPQGSPIRAHSPSSPMSSQAVPLRRPSPTSYMELEAPSKQPRLDRNLADKSRPTLSVPSSPCVINIAPRGDFRFGGSPEGVTTITERMQHLTRLTSRDDSSGGLPAPHVGFHRQGSLFDNRVTEPISDAEPEGVSDSDFDVSDGDPHYGRNLLVPEAAYVVKNGPQSYLPTVITTPPPTDPASKRNEKHITIGSQIPLSVRTAAEKPEDCCTPDKTDPECNQGDPKLLWEFIYQLLRDPDYASYVRWEDESRLVFRIVSPANLAALWGRQKNRATMTYEKLSRALRYYYKMNIIVKVPSRRLTYRFVQQPETIQKGQKGAKPGVAHKRRVPLLREAPKVSSTSGKDDEISVAGLTPTVDLHNNTNGCLESDESDLGPQEFRIESDVFSLSPSPSNGTLVEQRRPSPPLGVSVSAENYTPFVTSTFPDITETNVRPQLGQTGDDNKEHLGTKSAVDVLVKDTLSMNWERQTPPVKEEAYSEPPKVVQASSKVSDAVESMPKEVLDLSSNAEQ